MPLQQNGAAKMLCREALRALELSDELALRDDIGKMFASNRPVHL
jgi:hypothetical protein